MTRPVGPASVSAPAIPLASPYPAWPQCLPDAVLTAGRYVVRFARAPGELDQVLRLRYQVFNLELGEGLDESHITERDEDELDARFHHLVITESRSRRVVGTYRMQTAQMAGTLGGFYTAGEFDLSTFPAQVVADSVEIGRACVARDHRNGRVLHLLWRGLAAYLDWNRKRYLFGCCSLTSQDPALGLATLRRLETGGYLHPELRVSPLPTTRCTVFPGESLPEPHIPALFQAYLNLGALVCGPPALDRLFRTIDFLVLLDVERLSPRVFRSFFG